MQIKSVSLDNNNKKPTFLKNLRNYFNEYCRNSSIHGLKFLGERRRTFIERIWWLVTILICLYFCTVLIIEAYQKWTSSPVVVSFATSETPVWEIPFPAVTICPQIKAPKHLVNYTHLVYMRLNNQTLTDEQSKQLLYMSKVCINTDLNWFQDAELPDFIDCNDVIDFFMKVHPALNTTIKEFSWSGRNYTDQMHSLLTPILTLEGICYSFNLVDRDELFHDDVIIEHYEKYSIPHQKRSEWSKDTGYSKDADIEAYPKRSAVAGAYGGLRIIFKFNSSDMDYLCSDATEGYKIILHSPIQIPSVRSIYFKLGVNQDVTVAIKPTVMRTSEKLRRYKPQERKCYFERERQLKFFKIYDQVNCILECLTNYTYKRCGCAQFNLFQDNSTPICGPGKRKCLGEIGYDFLAKQINSKSHNIVENFCDCYPSCFSLGFETEISQTEWKWQEQENILSPQNNLEAQGIKLTRLYIFYNRLQFLTSERHELFGQMEFLASCGGLLGLFIGFSFISVMEIFYFLTLRFICNFRNFGKHYWAGNNFLENQTNL